MAEHPILAFGWALALIWCIKGFIRELMYYQQYRHLAQLEDMINKEKDIDSEARERIVDGIHYLMSHIRDKNKMDDNEKQIYLQRTDAILKEAKEQLLDKDDK